MNRLWPRLLTVVALALLLAGCVSSRPADALRGQALPAPDTTRSAAVYRDAGDYRIGPQDLLEISVLGVTDLGRTVRVAANGEISLPLVGSVVAGGSTVSELERQLAARFARGYLQNPQVSVFVKEFVSQRVTLEGAIRKPGIYPIMGRTSLLQAIALAEGLDPLADPRGVILIREIEGRRMAAAFDIRDVRSGRSVDPQVYGSDIVVVEQSGSKTALRRFLEVLPALGIFMAL